MSFEKDIVQAFYDGIEDKPGTTFGEVKADVIADKEPHFPKGEFMFGDPRLPLACPTQENGR